MTRTFDRVPFIDPRTEAYPMSLQWTEVPPLVSKYWNLDAWLDQGSEGACVGFGFAHELRAEPEVVPNVDSEMARYIYFNAQRIDPWAGGAYPGAVEFYEGTSTLAGAKFVKTIGHYESYLWATSEEDVARTVGNDGPVVIGVNWHEGMFDTDQDGFIWPAGEILGGHCVVVIGVNIEEGYYIIRNSWGRSWGVNGEAKIHRENMARLLAENGDAVKPIRYHIEPVAPEPIPVPVPVKCSIWRRIWCWLSATC
jgi:hypothetical protein